MTYGDWVKEPDLCWTLRNAHYELTCVVEIGTSESFRLEADARGWLENPKSPVQGVITVRFAYLCGETDRCKTLSVWRRGLVDVNTPSIWAPATQRGQMDIWYIADSIFTSAYDHDKPTDCFHLPLEWFVGRPAGPGEKDVMITKERMIELLRELSI